MQSSKALNEFILNSDALGFPISLNPIEREDGRTFVKFDEIKISAHPDRPGVALTTFLWRGTEMVYIAVQGYDAPPDQTLHLRGIEGRQEMSIA